VPTKRTCLGRNGRGRDMGSDYRPSHMKSMIPFETKAMLGTLFVSLVCCVVESQNIIGSSWPSSTMNFGVFLISADNSVLNLVPDYHFSGQSYGARS
jgi:hypothetical protein